MSAYNRVQSGLSAPPSPSSSSIRSPRLRPGRSGRPALTAGRLAGGPPAQGRTRVQRLAFSFLSLFLRRQGVFLFAPLVYIFVMLVYMGSVSLDQVPLIRLRPAPGSVYRSPEIYAKLRPFMDSENSSDVVCSCPNSIPPLFFFFIF